MKITKAIIAVAGYGTRFLPATKNLPKEMIPIIDKPIVQYLVEEAIASGIKDIILVTRYGQGVLENHFDSNFELETMLANTGKDELLEKVKKTYRGINFIFTRQGRHYPYGNGTPLLCAKNLIGKNESFVYMFGDDLVFSKVPAVAQLIDVWEKNDHHPVIACQEVAKSEVSKYGILKLKNGSNNELETAVEKPDPSEVKAPYLAQFGRFILNDKIVDIINKNYEENLLGKNNELWLIDSVVKYVKDHQVNTCKIDGQWMTTGDPLNFMKAATIFALSREDIGKDFKQFLKDLKL